MMAFQRKGLNSGDGMSALPGATSSASPSLAAAAVAVAGAAAAPASSGSDAKAKYSASTRALAALYYAVASALIMLANKIVLYVWGFPSSSVLALCQFVFSVLSLRVLRYFGVISFPETSVATLVHVFPLPLLFMGNAVSGLAGTGALSIPMFTVLRRTNMVLTMILEYVLLNYRFSMRIVLAVTIMMIGSAVAAAGDLAFDARGYMLVFVNNLMTSFMGVVLRMKLDASANQPEAKQALGMWGLMYNNSLVATPLLSLYLVIMDPQGVREAWSGFEHWNNPVFCSMFLLSAAMGTVLQLSIFYCTQVNSALATVVTGVLKNVVTSYAGMVSPGLGYTFSPLNFVGINVSMVRVSRWSGI